MKINLTKLLEIAQRIEPSDIQTRQTNASYSLKARRDATSSDEPYSFELEKETFSLENS
jgi:hypothetical protein